MHPGFVPSPSILVVNGGAPSAARFSHPTVRRRPSPRARFPHRGPTMMAKFQKKEEQAAPIEDENNIESIIPPAALPTLSTLSNSADIDLSKLSTDKEEEEMQVANMGPGLSAKDEIFLIQFLKGVREEFYIVEWPTFPTVLKITAIIIVSIVAAVFFIYALDGFFYKVFQSLYEMQG